MWKKQFRQISPGVCAATALALVNLSPALAADVNSIGQAVLVTGDVTGTVDQDIKRVVIKQSVVHDEIVATDPNAATEITFIDGTKFTVGPKARVVIDKFIYDPESKKGVLALSTTAGVFRFVTGQMSHDSYSITTPTGTLGVRGTEFDFAVVNGKTIVKVTSGAVVSKSGDVTQVINKNGCYTMQAQDVILCSPDDASTLAGLSAFMEALLAQPTAGGPPFAPPPQTTPPVFTLPPASPH